MTHRHFWRWLAALGVLAGLTGTLQAQTRYSYSSNGAEVTDSQTGLIWQRCSAGQSWSSNTCTGTATAYTHEAALVYAQTQTGWRLPNVKELSSIVDISRSNPAIDPVAFPATPSNGYWSASPYAGSAANAWVVNFGNGYVNHYGRDVNDLVRLVR